MNPTTISSKPRRSQVDRSAETRAVLIGAAVYLLSTVGFSKTTTQLIAKQAGVTTGALHHHFLTKDELMFAVLDHAAIHLNERLEAEVGTPLTGISRIRALVDHLWQVYGHPEYWAIWEIIIGTRADPDFHQSVVRHRAETMRTVVRPWLARLQLSPDAWNDYVETFEFLLIAIRGLGLERFLDQSDTYFDRHLSILAEFVGSRLEISRTAPPRPSRSDA